MNGVMGAIDKQRHIAATKAVIAQHKSLSDKKLCTSKTQNPLQRKLWCQAAFARSREAKRYKIAAEAHSYSLINSMEVLSKKIDQEATQSEQ